MYFTEKRDFLLSCVAAIIQIGFGLAPYYYTPMFCLLSIASFSVCLWHRSTTKRIDDSLTDMRKNSTRAAPLVQTNSRLLNKQNNNKIKESNDCRFKRYGKGWSLLSLRQGPNNGNTITPIQIITSFSWSLAEFLLLIKDKKTTRLEPIENRKNRLIIERSSRQEPIIKKRCTHTNK